MTTLGKQPSFPRSPRKMGALNPILKNPAMHEGKSWAALTSPQDRSSPVLNWLDASARSVGTLRDTTQRTIPWSASELEKIDASPGPAAYAPPAHGDPHPHTPGHVSRVRNPGGRCHFEQRIWDQQGAATDLTTIPGPGHTQGEFGHTASRAVATTRKVRCYRETETETETETENGGKQQQQRAADHSHSV